MRCKWFELSVRIDNRWESFEDDNIFRLARRVMEAKSRDGKKVVGSLTINFPR